MISVSAGCHFLTVSSRRDARPLLPALLLLRR
jgi:hypothetical protein